MQHCLPQQIRDPTPLRSGQGKGLLQMAGIQSIDEAGQSPIDFYPAAVGFSGTRELLRGQGLFADWPFHRFNQFHCAETR